MEQILKFYSKTERMWKYLYDLYCSRFLDGATNQISVQNSENVWKYFSDKFAVSASSF